MSEDIKYSNLQINSPTQTSFRSTLTKIKRKSSQRVSFTKTKPKVYERTPESSISNEQLDNTYNTIQFNNIKKIHTVV